MTTEILSWKHLCFDPWSINNPSKGQPRFFVRLVKHELFEGLVTKE